MMADTKRQVPNLRFKGFTDDWEQRKLGEISTSFSGGTPSVKNKSYYGGKIPFIRSAEIHKDKTELFITESGLKNSSAKLIKKGTLLYALYGATSGEVDVSNIDGAINQAIMAIFLQKDNVSFIKYYLEKNKDKIIAKYLQGGQGNLSASIIKSVHINLPFTEEQLKISNLIKKVESLIFLQQRKLALLKQLKKGLLQKMFADKDSKQPVLRFKGFHDDWEHRKLGDIALFSKGKGISKKDLQTHGIYNIVHYADVYKFMPVQDKVLHHSNNKMGVRIGSNSLLFAGSDVTPKGLARTTAIKQENVRVGGDVIIADLSEKHLNYFMSYEINMNKRFIYPFITGSTVRHIHGSDLSHLNITFPSLSEQKNIAHIFNLIEHELSLLKIKKSKYQSIKKSLLQQMFI